MKVMKVYGKKGEYSVYVNGEKTPVESIENAIVFDNVSSYGFGVDNQLVIIEAEEERKFLEKTFEETEMPYSLYKELSKLPGSGYLKKGEYNADKKTIKVSKWEVK